MDVRTPFVLLDPVKPTVWQKILRRKPQENAVVEINNRFARAASVRDISPADLSRIFQSYRADMGGAMGGRLERLYRDYLTYCLQDRRLSQEEIADLSHLKAVLRIGDETIAAIHEYVARHVYRRTVSEVLADGVIDEDERAFLATVQRELALSGSVAARIEEAKLREH